MLTLTKNDADLLSLSADVLKLDLKVDGQTVIVELRSIIKSRSVYKWGSDDSITSTEKLLNSIIPYPWKGTLDNPDYAKFKIDQR